MSPGILASMRLGGGLCKTRASDFERFRRQFSNLGDRTVKKSRFLRFVLGGT
jgi:hypothetical protein